MCQCTLVTCSPLVICSTLEHSIYRILVQQACLAILIYKIVAQAQPPCAIPQSLIQDLVVAARQKQSVCFAIGALKWGTLQASRLIDATAIPVWQESAADSWWTCAIFRDCLSPWLSVGEAPPPNVFQLEMRPSQDVLRTAQWMPILLGLPAIVLQKASDHQTHRLSTPLKLYPSWMCH